MNRTDTIQTGDCLTILPTLPADSAHLAYIDPPFTIGLTYPGYHDRRPQGEYFAWLEVASVARGRTLAFIPR